MPSNIQFVIATGDASAEKKRALRKLVRSHVAAQHYREKREKDVRNYGLSMGNMATGPQALTSPENNAIDFRQGQNQAIDSRKMLPLQWAGRDVPRTIDTSYPGLKLQSNTSCNNDTDSPWDFAFQLNAISPLAYLGQGTSDPFIKVPLALSSRMQKHLFYC
jgi:hypothetical protein